MFAEAKEGNIRLIVVDIQEGMLLRRGGGDADVPSLNFKSSCLLLKRRSFHSQCDTCICDFPCHCCGLNPSSCHFICLMLLFRDHVACWKFTLTGPCYWDLLYLLDKKVMAVYQ